MSQIRTGDQLARFVRKVRVQEGDDACWLWVGAVQSRGYGSVGIDGRTHLAHRVSYQTFVAPIPDDLQIDHTCRVHQCVRPSHLEPVTHRENALRGEGAGRTECKWGHPLEGENLYVKPSTGRRECVTCRREQKDRWRERAA